MVQPSQIVPLLFKAHQTADSLSLIRPRADLSFQSQSVGTPGPPLIQTLPLSRLHRRSG